MKKKQSVKPAENLEELVKNLNSIEPLTRDMDIFYVPIYERQIKILQTSLILSQLPLETFLVTGQQGTGKTTALMRVPNEQLNKNYTFIHIQAGMSMNLDDLDVIELLIFIGFEIISRYKKLENKYYEKLDFIQGIKQGTTEELKENITDTGGGIGLNLGISAEKGIFSFVKAKGEVLGSIRLDKEYRKIIRKRFALKKSQLLELINDIISEYEEKEKKKLVLIIDDLEKMKDPDQMRELFINNIDVIKNIKCRKILTYPIHLTLEREFNEADAYRFVLRINTPPGHPEDKVPLKNRELLKQIANKRMEKKLISDEALELAVEYSGGIIRQYINLLRFAITIKLTFSQDNNAMLTTEDIQEAIKWYRREMSGAVINFVRVLDYIMNNHLPPEEVDKRELTKAINGNQVLVYFNDQTWYDVNPILKPVIKDYLK